MIEQTVSLTGSARPGRFARSKACGIALSVLPDLARQATGLAFARSPSQGRPPAWLAEASDLALVDVRVDAASDTTVVRYALPRLGDVADEAFGQQTIPGLERDFPRPDRAATALDLMAEVIADLAADAVDSPRLDPVLIDTAWKLHRALNGKGGYQALLLERSNRLAPVRFTADQCARVGKLRDSTPVPRAVRVEGKLDMIWDSTGSFALLLDDGQTLPGAFADDLRDDVASLFRQRVTVAGRAVYRPSGRPLRLEAEVIEPCVVPVPAFSQVPAPVSRSGRPIRMHDLATRNGLADLVGLLDDPAVDDASLARMVEEMG